MFFRANLIGSELIYNSKKEDAMLTSIETKLLDAEEEKNRKANLVSEKEDGEEIRAYLKKEAEKKLVLMWSKKPVKK